MMGKPVIKGTCITVELILEKSAAGESIEDIFEAHPHLPREAVLQIANYALRIMYYARQEQPCC